MINYSKVGLGLAYENNYWELGLLLTKIYAGARQEMDSTTS